MKRKKLDKSMIIRIALEDYEWLEKMAAKEERTISNYVRKLFHAARMNGSPELLEACRKVLELAKDTEFMEHPTMEFVEAAVKRAEEE